MGQINRLSLRKSLIAYIAAFLGLAAILSAVTFAVCGNAVESILASYPPSGEKYYLTNEQGEQLGEGAYIGKDPVPMTEQDERMIEVLEAFPVSGGSPGLYGNLYHCGGDAVLPEQAERTACRTAGRLGEDCGQWPGFLGGVPQRRRTGAALQVL